MIGYDWSDPWRTEPSHCCGSEKSDLPRQVLAGKLKPNLGRFDNPPDWQAGALGPWGNRGRGSAGWGACHEIPQ